ncbi:MAG: hypothetical protein V9F01_04990 [Chitinophagaceae bacterium]
MPVVIRTQNAIAMLREAPSNKPNIDFYFTILGDKETRLGNISVTVVSEISNKLEYLSEALQTAEFYIDYGDLLFLVKDNNIPLVKSLVQELTKNPVGELRFNAELILENYPVIKSTVFDNNSELVNCLFDRLNTQFETIRTTIENRDFSTFISLELISDSIGKNNQTTNLIIEKANDFLKSSSIESWKEALKTESGYLYGLLNLLNTNNILFQNNLSSNAIIAYKDCVRDSATDATKPNNVNLWFNLFDLLGDKMEATYEEVRQRLLFSTGELSNEVIVFFSRGLFKLKLLFNRENSNQIVRRIILPLVKDPNSLSFVDENQDDILQIFRNNLELKDEILEAFSILDNEFKAKREDLLKKIELILHQKE